MTRLCLILGDQLSHNISSLKFIDKKNDLILLAEVLQEAKYVKHHKQKIAFIFSAMRHFADELKAKGYNVQYSKIDDKENSNSLIGEILRHHKKFNFSEIFITEPAEFRLLLAFSKLALEIDCRLHLLSDDRFFSQREFFAKWANGKKQLVMEFFYRELRKKTKILMKDGKPIGGKWNFDNENRKNFQENLPIKESKKFVPDQITKEVLEIILKNFSDHFGDLENFNFAVSRQEALEAFDYFLQNNLKYFGDFQDVMVQDQPFLFHSQISTYLNSGLLEPLELCKKAEEYYHQGLAPLNAVEGFIRQILGWREYIRGIYWHFVPDYLEKNFFNAKNKLPDFYWSAKSDLNCINNVVEMTKNHAYSHHIQRLMVTGNFALLCGFDVKEVHEWYLAVYSDAYEWVEAPNVIGMALFADGGIVGTKPYISSGAYINRMSNFCKNCQFDVKDLLSPKACPFNSLYWNFLITHEKKLRSNQRMRIAYSNLDKFSADKKQQIQEKANNFIKSIC